MKNTYRELNIVINVIVNGESQEVKCQIIRRNKKENLLYVRLLEENFIEEIEVGEELEVRILEENHLYSFFSTVINKSRKLNQICVIEPKQMKKSKKRKSKRYKFEIDMEIISSKKNIFAKTFNLSKSGIGFYCKEFFYLGDILFITFYNSVENKRYNLEIEIKNLFIEKNGYIRYGAEFSDCTENKLENLLKILKDRDKRKKIKLQKLIQEKLSFKKDFESITASNSYFDFFKRFSFK